MKPIIINTYFALLVILLVALGATALVLNTLHNLQKELPPQQLYQIP